MKSFSFFSRFSNPFQLPLFRSNLVFPASSCARPFHNSEIMSSVTNASVKVLVVGGAYGGLSAALNLLDLSRGKATRMAPRLGDPTDRKKVDIKFRIVDERDGYFHLIGSPLAFASAPEAERFWVKYTDIAALRDDAITVIQGSVSKIDPATKTATILDSKTKKQYEESYDFLIAASGLRRVKQVVPQALTKEEYLEEAKKQIEAVGVGEGVQNRKGVVVIGGGAVGIEMASEIALVHPTQRVTLIHSRERLLSAEPLPAEVAEYAVAALRRLGVEVVLGHRVNSSVQYADGKYLLKLSDGTKRTAGAVIWALSKQQASSSYLPKDTLDEDGLVQIDSTLHFKNDLPNSKYHYAVGDIAKWSGIKRCGAAMHMGFLAANNIYQDILASIGFIKAPKYVTFPEVPPMIALACGKEAISYSQEEGAAVGEDIMKMFFEGDLGFRICWDYLQLGKENVVAEDAETPEEVKTLEKKIDVVAISA
ncbi:hypothetical protein BJ875DRAFT_462882 [Amylocarpus encephaloides]|uniref:FAD/NAD(P)-binding domain-containing protein n=1 Tax=Amylocarpus encephaloides TaxID=45428 RepID=A0A9P7YI33_9HELO|nr:hypothetical protein BJ875DRAFT_462882 [Amylocarpus encephaloides]